MHTSYSFNFFPVSVVGSITANQFLSSFQKKKKNEKREADLESKLNKFVFRVFSTRLIIPLKL